jgi:hypothetical protein
MNKYNVVSPHLAVRTNEALICGAMQIRLDNIIEYVTNTYSIIPFI